MSANPSPAETFSTLRRGYQREPNPTAAVREDRLDRLHELVRENAEAFEIAIDADFGGRSRHETQLADIIATLDSVRTARRNLRTWMEPESVAPGPFFRPGRAYVEALPLGVIGIIAPWNYPVNLALGPLASALAAGNRAILKPSEATPRTAALLGRAIRDRFTAEEVAVVEGGPDVARALTALPLDHLFFTGSTAVGRAVALAAAANLVPVTLELGGKSPVYIHADYPLAKRGVGAVERIAIGKLFNAGQTCVAPDYVLLPVGKEEVFVEAMRDVVRSRWGEVSESAAYTSLASDAGYRRMVRLLEEARAAGARIESVGGPAPGPWVPGGPRKLALQVVIGARLDSALLTEEIFGPILPVVTYRSEAEALEFIRARPRPLAAYCFDPDVQRARNWLSGVVSGGAVINDTVVHFAQENLPFGGVGQSGMGACHGRAGFNTFSHRRGTLKASAFAPAWHLLPPPYGRALDGAIAVLKSGVGAWLG